MHIDGDEKDEIDEIDETVIVDDNDEADAGDDDTNGDEVELDPKNTSIRDSLKNAFKKATAESENEPDDKTPPEDKKAVAKTKTESNVSDKGTKIDSTTKPIEGEIKPPPGWSKEAKAKFPTLPPEVVQSIAKREKEVSDGFAQYSEKTKRYEELETVLAPRREAIKSYGASEAQIVNNLFQWMEGLTGPNKLEVYRQLGNNFKIDVSSLVEPAATTPENNQDDVPEPLRQFMQTIEAKVGSFEANQTAILERERLQRESAAAELVTNWSKDKKHFNAVRPLMHTLLGSGSIPLKDGALDLDAAYEAAIYATAGIRELHLGEQKEAADAKAAADKAKMEEVRRAKIAKAKKAGVSIKASAPTAGTSVTPGKQVNGQTMSIRESLKAAIRESAN